MRILPVVACLILSVQLSIAQQRLLDHAMILKSCNVTIDANPFTAKTFIELEFYNPESVEIEGYETFVFDKGQVITGFQLELDGKYRDASIEEKWKANNAYRSIVGKRIDPAILQMTGSNTYSLHIYPIPAKKSRKVTITLIQMMKHIDDRLVYELPLKFSSVTSVFRLHVNGVNMPSIPVSDEGIMKGRPFSVSRDISQLRWVTADVKLNSPLKFYVPLAKDRPLICVTGQPGSYQYMMRVNTDNTTFYQQKNKKLLVYWDVSGSSITRKIPEEVSFLERYIKANRVTDVRIIAFNDRVVKDEKFILAGSNTGSVRQFLLSLDFGGPTNFSSLDFSGKNEDVAFVFTDGINTATGRKIPYHGAVQVSCIVSSAKFDKPQLIKIIGTSGGSVIDLNKVNIDSVITAANISETYLMSVSNNQDKVKHPSLPVKADKPLFFTWSSPAHTAVKLKFGNNRRTSKELSAISFILWDESVYKQVELIRKFDSIKVSGSWRDIILFGLNERVITASTSFLVLERIEDYINYKIAPPKELEKECSERGYVYRSEHKVMAMNRKTEKERLSHVADLFNKRIKWWGTGMPLIDLENSSRTLAVRTDGSGNKAGSNSVSAGISQQPELNGNVNTIQEVIVTGAFNTRRTARSSSTSVQNISSEQLNVIRQSDINNALAGKVAGAQVRSQSVAAIGRETQVRLRGENGISLGKGPIYVANGTLIPSASDINVDDIEDVTVLQGPAAAALFGPDGSDGAIVINLKKGRTVWYSSWSEYRLSDLEDEDYIQKMRHTSKQEMWDEYVRMSSDYPASATFHFDMADQFYQNGLKAEAFTILGNGIEFCEGSTPGIFAAAYLLESWGEFSKAIELYEGVLEGNEGDLTAMRNLALACFQDGRFQRSLDMYYKIIADDQSGYYDNMYLKEIALYEMNAVILQHRKNLDLSRIDPALIKQLPVDLKISVESNLGNYGTNYHVIDPAGAALNKYNNHYYSDRHDTAYFRKYYRTFTNDIGIMRAFSGNYKIRAGLYNYYHGSIPHYMRIVTFRDMHKSTQSLEVQTVNVTNQHGLAEIGRIKW